MGEVVKADHEGQESPRHDGRRQGREGHPPEGGQAVAPKEALISSRGLVQRLDRASNTKRV